MRKMNEHVNTFLISTYDEAEDLVAELVEMAEYQNYITVADYYDIIGVNSERADGKRGWTDAGIQDTRIVPVDEGGYILVFAPLVPLPLYDEVK